ncbi:Hemicentin-2 [Atta colombica]|uniref:Hemicentin-2 n=1 Tax=Atta colombica TaxID=520822 RepID=A0A195B9C7_9HYME|nr:Hemicentin-2 [Atta colombica]
MSRVHQSGLHMGTRTHTVYISVLSYDDGVGVSHCQVTWIRRKDRQLLTVGRSTHSIDTRFVVSNGPGWNLLIKNVNHEDAGLYECQIQTEPMQQRFIRLNITEAYSVIPGGPDLHVKQGSSLRLECQLMAAAESPNYVFWYRETRMINYDNEPGVRFELKGNGSVFIVEKVKLSHGANYTCLPNNARPAHIVLHVIEEEEKPAAMHGGDRRNSTATTSTNIILILVALLIIENRASHFIEHLAEANVCERGRVVMGGRGDEDSRNERMNGAQEEEAC